jgi:hypothetical protein
MHNLHLLRIRATSPQQACTDAETAIEDWGDENNGRTICGCVSQDNKVHTASGEHDWIDHTRNTITRLNKLVAASLRTDVGPMGCNKNTFLAVAACIKDGVKIVDDLDVYRAKRYLEHYDSVMSAPRADKFNVLKHQFNPEKYDEFGLTDITDQGSKKGKLYIVFLDMHS